MDQQTVDIIKRHFIGIDVYSKPIKAFVRVIPAKTFCYAGTKELVPPYEETFVPPFFIWLHKNGFTKSHISINEDDLRVQVLMVQKLNEYKQRNR